MFLSMNNFFREFWADLILKQKIYKQGPKLHFQKKKKNFWVLHNKSFFIDREKSREKEKGFGPTLKQNLWKLLATDPWGRMENVFWDSRVRKNCCESGYWTPPRRQWWYQLRR